MILISKFHSDDELELKAEMSKIMYLISICNLGVEATEKQIKELSISYDDNRVTLQMLDKKADVLTKAYLKLNQKLERLLKQVNNGGNNE